MNLADMLGYADIRQLTQIAGAYGCECDGHSKHELMQAILQTVGRRELFDERIQAMPLEDLRFLQSILFDEQSAFSLEELIARVRQSRFESVEARSGGFRPEVEPGAGEADEAADAAAAAGSRAVTQRTDRGRTQTPAATSGKREKSAAAAANAGYAAKTIVSASNAAPPAKSGRKRAAADRRAEPQPAEPGPRDTIVRFKMNGWLFNGITGTGRYLFHVPDDLKRRFREALWRKLAAGVEPAGEPAVYRDEHVLMEADLAALLRYAGTEEIPLTQDGVMYRRQLGQLIELFAVQEQPPSRSAWRFGYGRRFKDYPDRLALLYDYAHSRRWITEDNFSLRLTDAGREQLQTGMTDEPDGLFRFWLRLYRKAIPNLPALIYWIETLAAGWVTENSLNQALLPFVKPFYYDAPETVLRLRVTGMLVHFGMLSAGEHEESGPVLRVTKRGRELAESARSPGKD